MTVRQRASVPEPIAAIGEAGLGVGLYALPLPAAVLVCSVFANALARAVRRAGSGIAREAAR